MESMDAKVGGYTPENWIWAYKRALDKTNMKWKKEPIKIIIRISEAGAHSERFSERDTKHNSKENETELENLIK